ncbi:MAG: hypothetical protein IT452_16680 [Planctomycetia bacterium]|nr:hypothetical protein [Planctomycetia bacterium]
MPDRIVFNVVIPRTDEFTGLLHPLSKLRAWFARTAALEFCRGGSEVGVNLHGLWFDDQALSAVEPVQDVCNWYKFAVPTDRVDALRKHVEAATQEFGQKCIYLERAGEADFIVNPALRPAG